MPLASSDGLKKQLQSGLKNKLFTHAVASVWNGTDWKVIDPLGCRETWFDLSSLTKVLGTTTWIALQMKEQPGLLETKFIDCLSELSKSLGVAVPKDLSQKLQGATIADVLSHRAPLVWRLELFKQYEKLEKSDDHQLVFKKYFEEFVARGIETRSLGHVVYSDVGYVLLGFYFSLKRGKPWDELVNEILPQAKLAWGSPKKADVAPTGRCPWRKKIIKGSVQDEEAALLGGACGHAGLFGTVEGVMAQADIWIHALGDGESPLPKVIAQQFCAGPFRGISQDGYAFRLGWDGAVPGGALSKGGWSDATFGHWGFTGVGLWCDPKGKKAMILLTNRVNEGSEKMDAYKSWRNDVFNLKAHSKNV